MLNVNKIESDINSRNLQSTDVCKILGIKYTTAIGRREKGNWTPDDVEKFADYFNRPIAYYFDRDEKETKNYKQEESVNRVEDPAGIVNVKTFSCTDCIEKERVIAAQKETIEIQRKYIASIEGSYAKNGKANCG